MKQINSKIIHLYDHDVLKRVYQCDMLPAMVAVRYGSPLPVLA